MKFIRFVLQIGREITWPSKKTLLVSLVAVILISVIISAYLIGLDTIFIYLRNLILFK